MEWKLTTLIENHEDTEEKYVCEHGFSILIEKLDSKPPIRLLMDTGQSGAFFDNAEKMGVSLDKLDALLLVMHTMTMWVVWKDYWKIFR